MAAAYYKKPRLRDVALRRLILVVSLTLSGVLLLVYLFGSNPASINDVARDLVENLGNVDDDDAYRRDLKVAKGFISLPNQNDLSLKMEKLNALPPRNLDLYPNLSKDRIIVVLYVHNRPLYLKIVIDSLSQVAGINETLLIVSHDGYFEDMNKIIDGIRFCQVKQIFAPYSPHLFLDTFPGVSAHDCKDKDVASQKHCEGNPDQYGNHRSPRIVSLKHHWWWMMNTVWDGLRETRKHEGHILFIEEDHFIYPNAYRNLQTLISLKPEKCPDCYAANLAPSDVTSRGEGWASLIAERMGNVGYAFNRTVWKKIHNKAREFCFFDDYNWDITMWATVYPSFGSPVYSLRGSRTSALHFGRCGLHQGQGEKKACIDNGMVNIHVEDADKVPNIASDWSVHIYKNQPGYKAGFKGWGGWGDDRDRHLCLSFSNMYRSTGTSSPL
ncbi:Alpha-1,6-mannosyl-glycoprotein 2-beta-N-acetylglucosaminyltransferase [Stylosanthes scabra]|uniref:Alpha-1,6-mannosyl-glycoprotein 2-beta-N-acetylglucosaminyltransferase n=1 Tax=Stylosanthes scabra TaxID=79078 RepID=A0ABU6YAA0_9FABA|nr:Alpha-1,6-mannosyl-glycoprotein 2-beta-N-acetylglucosaminyltransferase [Stylosanthes scabra]